PLRDNDPVCACDIRGPYDRTQVMGILDPVQKDEKRILSPLLCQVQHIFHLCIIIRGSIGYDSLMPACLAELGQAFLPDKIQDRAVLFCLPDNGAHRAVLTAVQHKDLVNGAPRPERLQHRVASLNDKRVLPVLSRPPCIFVLIPDIFLHSVISLHTVILLHPMISLHLLCSLPCLPPSCSQAPWTPAP